jgi:hypothetical protein
MRAHLCRGKRPVLVPLVRTRCFAMSYRERSGSEGNLPQRLVGPAARWGWGTRRGDRGCPSMSSARSAGLVPGHKDPLSPGRQVVSCPCVRPWRLRGRQSYLDLCARGMPVAAPSPAIRAAEWLEALCWSGLERRWEQKQDMATTVAEQLIELSMVAGVRRACRVLGDRLNSVVDGVGRTAGIERVDVRNAQRGGRVRCDRRGAARTTGHRRRWTTTARPWSTSSRTPKP